MQSVQFDSKEQLANGFGASSNAGQMPARSGTFGKAATRVNASGEDDVAQPRSLVSRVFRFARNAAIGLIVISAIPLATVQWLGGRSVGNSYVGVADRVQEVNRLRPLMAVKDASITPLEAGIAFAALQGVQASAAFPVRSAHAAPDLAWKRLSVTAEMFKAGPPGSERPSAKFVVEGSVAGYSADEIAYLRSVAESPVWADFDRVAKANSVDIIGGAFTLPFQSDASSFEMPITHFAELRSLAEAGVSRAAYYLAIKDEVRAEAALRSIISVGFAMIDNGHSTIDAIMGRIIVGIGRNGMEQFNTATHRVVPADQDASYRPFEAKPGQGGRMNSDAYRAHLLADANNAALPQSVRFESLSQLSMRSCGSVSEMLFGPKEDIVNAFTNAERTLGQSASGKAYLELLRELPNRPVKADLSRWQADQFVFGAADIAAAITRTPRIAACTRMVVLGP